MGPRGETPSSPVPDIPSSSSTGHRGERLRPTRGLLAVLVASFLLRAVLILSGGQGYWPDESRYQRSRWAARAIEAGDVAGAIQILNRADHFLFKVIGVAPALLEPVWGPSLRWPALFFSFFSVANVWLLWAILRRLGESEWTALCAAGLLALSATFLYYARHLVPYDTAMSLCLLSLLVGLRRPLRNRDSVLCGVLAAAAFVTYYGYWLLAGFALAAHVLQPASDAPTRFRRALVAGLAFLAPCAILIAAGAAAGGNLPQQVIEFSRNVSQGSYAEGWSLPFEYFWHAEHWLLLLWIGSVVFGVRELVRGSRREALVLAVAGIVFVYGGLVLFSSVLGKLVVYGRLARELVPFFCILSALFLDRLRLSAPRGRALAAALLALASCQALVNFARPFSQMFPAEFRRLAATTAEDAGAGRYETLFVHPIYPLPGTPPREEGEVLLWRRHPLEYRPYQYEGYGPEARRALEATDIRMRLIRHRAS